MLSNEDCFVNDGKVLNEMISFWDAPAKQTLPTGRQASGRDTRRLKGLRLNGKKEQRLFYSEAKGF